MCDCMEQSIWWGSGCEGDAEVLLHTVRMSGSGTV